jgi:hypothetical protein
VSDIRLPKWKPVHVNLSTDHVDRDFLEDAAKKMESGYFVVEGDGTYLLVSHRGVICEVGSLDTEDGRRNIGQAFERVTLTDIDRVLDGKGGSVSAYSLPRQVCIDLCGVINGRAQYGDLNTDILELDELLGKLEEDGFDGSVMFTSDDEYALVEYEDGERAGFRYEGDGEVKTPQDLTERSVGRMETNVFVPRDEEDIDAPTPKKQHDDDVEMINYTGIAGALADATAEISSRDRFESALEEQLSLVDGAKFDGGNVVTAAPEKEDVFNAYRKAVEASAELVPPSKIYDEASVEVEDMEGGEGFLAYAE